MAVLRNQAGRFGARPNIDTQVARGVLMFFVACGGSSRSLISAALSHDGMAQNGGLPARSTVRGSV